MITLAVERGGFVYVYGDGNRQIASQAGSLHGYTSTTFSVKRDGYVYTYDERNHQISSQYVGR